MGYIGLYLVFTAVVLMFSAGFLFDIGSIKGALVFFAFFEAMIFLIMVGVYLMEVGLR